MAIRQRNCSEATDDPIFSARNLQCSFSITLCLSRKSRMAQKNSLTQNSRKRNKTQEKARRKIKMSKEKQVASGEWVLTREWNY
uniref:Uncharacterized protein n=1 Tax=Rhizophora mucronata TaxID=61149 RepID=A0A2P2PPL4_RHIMU